VRRSSLLVFFSLALAFVLAPPIPLAAQGGMLGRIKQKAAEEAKRRAEEKAERAVDKAIDNAENAITCVVTDVECIKRAEKSGKKVIVTNADGTVAAKDAAKGSDAEAAAKQRPGEGAWANYDFVPGEKPLLLADFADDVIGDFPRRLEASEGNFEVVEWQGSRWLRANGHSNLMFVPVDAPLPTRWTLEFELLGEEGNSECWIYPSGTREGAQAHLRFSAAHSGTAIRADGRDAGARETNGDTQAGKPYTARVMADGRYVKAYVNETRVVNLPNFDYTRASKVLFYCDGNEEKPLFLRNIRLAAGGRKLYDALAESGRVATQGIYFSTGSDQLRPESTPTLKEIGAMLSEHPALRLVIEGHTDNTGAAAANKTLSEKRATAVRQYLVSTHGIAADRLTAVGVGQERPSAANTTPEGRQQNRRVELVQVK